MNVQITGKNLDIGQALPEYIRESIVSLMAKYFQKADSIRVVIERSGDMFKSEIYLHVNRLVAVNAEGDAGDAYSAYDLSLMKLSKRLRRKKRRYIDKHREHHFEG